MWKYCELVNVVIKGFIVSDNLKSHHIVWQSWQSRGSCIWRRQGRRRHRAQRPVDQHIHLEETKTKVEGEKEKSIFLYAVFSYIVQQQGTLSKEQDGSLHYVYYNDSSIC